MHLLPSQPQKKTTTYSIIHWQAVHRASNLLLQYKSGRNNFLSDEMNYLHMLK